jgi:hypothetical protein
MRSNKPRPKPFFLNRLVKIRNDFLNTVEAVALATDEASASKALLQPSFSDPKSSRRPHGGSPYEGIANTNG